MAETPSRKEQTHQHIVRTAARAVRRDGFAGVGVAAVMKEAGLTHGGFYAHFDSKDALLTEVTDRAGAESSEGLARIAAAAPAGQAFEALVDAYLSDAHVKSPESGCPMAAVGSEIGRQDAAIRRVATRRMKETVDLLAGALPGGSAASRRDTALAAYCGLVGALIVSRAVDDPGLSKALRDATRRLLRTPGD